MKIITLLCACLWAMAAFFDLYNMTMGDYPLLGEALEAPIDAGQSILWLLIDGATAAFFFVLWDKRLKF